MPPIHSIETFTRDGLNLVRVRAEDGAEGVGQTAFGHPEIVAEVLHRQVAPHALGQPAEEPEALHARVLAAEAKFNGAHLSKALAGLDTALWDLRGRRAGKPVAVLLAGGAAVPDRIPCYASYLRRDTAPEAVLDRLRRARDAEGHRAFKVKIGRRRGGGADEWPGRTEALARALREGLGPDAVLMADANSCYGPAAAIEVGRMLEGHGFAQFEEPCPHQELEWTAEVAAALGLEVCGGEQDHDVAQFRRMVAMRAVDVLQPDVCHAGGLTVARTAAKLAAEAGLPCQPHSANRSLVLVFALHLHAGVPNRGRFVEWAVDAAPGPLPYAPAPVAEDGHLRLPAGPGWGVRPNPDWLSGARRRVSPEPPLRRALAATAAVMMPRLRRG
jgi:L-alanine-DL-glutamate epimerase-like enolase superfamily enzyme